MSIRDVSMGRESVAAYEPFTGKAGTPDGLAPLKYSGNDKEILLAIKALSDETRVRILRILSIAPLNVQEVTEVLYMGQSRISRHLKILTDAGFLVSQREGSWVYYRPKELGKTDDFSAHLHALLLKFESSLPYSEQDLAKTKGILKQRDLKTAKYFDDVAQNWETIQSDVLDPVLYRNKILGLLPEHSRRIFDLGCGPGGLIPYLLTKSQEVLGIDSSAKMIKEAKNLFLNNSQVHFLESEIESLPVELANQADSVVSSMVLHHLSNPAKAMREVHSVLKENGTFIIVDLKKHNQEIMRDNFADLWLGFEPELLTDWLEHTGFQVQSIEEVESQKYFKVLIIKAKKRGGL
ncbi:methyltransferase domain-containing protein [Leptospira langatensis]|uniref:Methyltransferase domain-containing protein n=1 Tax=Leptospira langatensis TaxID=2484983 RepID=A0A5F1ZRU6_9LEPT|nr:metalloregulator ArsR/SmtB family transcription factor [Leptospira langatensis]TGK01926.1 methyltransferase domain-containing protein [Leptospira langatensis]TGL39281.1 methyltransferase domain-containing protein [Leptospira langatensis]